MVNSLFKKNPRQRMIFIMIISSLILMTFSSMAEGAQIASHTTCGNVDRSVKPRRPISPRTIFYNTDTSVYSVAVWKEETAGYHVIRFDWIDPNGQTYHESNNHYQQTSNEARTWSWDSRLNVAGTPAASRIGRWAVSFYIDGNLMFTDYFEIRSSTSSTAHTTGSYSTLPAFLNFLTSTQSVQTTTVTETATKIETVTRTVGIVIKQENVVSNMVLIAGIIFLAFGLGLIAWNMRKPKSGGPSKPSAMATSCHRLNDLENGEVVSCFERAYPRAWQVSLVSLI